MVLFILDNPLQYPVDTFIIDHFLVHPILVDCRPFCLDISHNHFFAHSLGYLNILESTWHSCHLADGQ